MNKQNRQQLLTILAMAAISLWVGDKFVLSPLTKSWKARTARIAELRKSVDHGSKLVEREESIHSRWDAMRTNTFPRAVSLSEGQLLKSFDRWSRDSQISVTSIKPQWKGSPDDDYMTLECRVDAFGSMQTLTRFLYNIEKDPLALKVDLVEISGRDNEGQQLTLGLQVSGLLLNPPE